MKDQSPLYHAERITKPLLVGQGANDPAIKRSQSDQMVAAAKAAGASVTDLLFTDEGHGFLRAEDRLSFHAVEEQFLAQCLGGRAEALTTSDLKASTVQALEGADNIPGLAAALAERVTSMQPKPPR